MRLNHFHYVVSVCTQGSSIGRLYRSSRRNWVVYIEDGLVRMLSRNLMKSKVTQPAERSSKHLFPNGNCPWTRTGTAKHRRIPALHSNQPTGCAPTRWFSLSCSLVLVDDEEEGSGVLWHLNQILMVVRWNVFDTGKQVSPVSKLTSKKTGRAREREKEKQSTSFLYLRV